jgi:hypothetical protein
VPPSSGCTLSIDIVRRPLLVAAAFVILCFHVYPSLEDPSSKNRRAVIGRRISTHWPVVDQIGPTSFEKTVLRARAVRSGL